MQRQLAVKLLSGVRRNASSSVSSSIVSEPLLPSSLFRGNVKTLHREFFTQCSTAQRSNLWMLGSNNGVSRRILNGFFSNQVLVRRLYSNAFLKGLNKLFFSGTGRGYTRRNFHSFDSHNRGWRSGFRRLTADGVVIGLVVANAAVFILWRVASPQFMVKNFMISVDNFTSGRVHTLITSAFSHRDMWHLISNMVGLYFFGSSIGRAFGPEYLLKLYLSGAIVGSIFFLAYHAFIAPQLQRKPMFGIDPSRIPGLGASGAVNAIMLLDIFLYPKKTLLLDFIIPVPAILLGIFIVGKDILRIFEGDQEVSGSAHLGGAMVAAVAWAQVRRGRFRRF